jgi:hypothetical protein
MAYYYASFEGYMPTYQKADGTWSIPTGEEIMV